MRPTQARARVQRSEVLAPLRAPPPQSFKTIEGSNLNQIP
jgi:hypothetical protein